MNRLFKNFILCGEADFHCLLCNENFTDNQELEKHIRWEKHRLILKKQIYIPKLKNDSICKNGDYFYCEHCNFTVKGFANIKKHVDTETHKNYKTDPNNFPKRIEAKYIETDSILVDKFILKKLQWHGLINKECVFCDVAVENIPDHIKLQEHMINLIQSRVYSDNDKVYRKINDKTFQCFICKKAFPLEILEEHWNDHDTAANPPNFVREVNWENRVIVRADDKILMAEMLNKEYELKDLDVTDDYYFNIDIKRNKITCKTCNKPVKLSTKDLKKHVFDHRHKIFKSCLLDAVNRENDKEYLYCSIVDHGKARAEAAKYGRQHYIKLNASGSRAYCTLCDKFLSTHIDIFKDHVEGKYHKGHLEIKGLISPRKHIKASYRSENIWTYIKTIVYSTALDWFWINVEYMINDNSFLLLKKIDHGTHFMKTKCFACDVIIEQSEVKQHCLTTMHKTKFIAARVTINEGHDFIREICPRLYHCALCNVSIPLFETIAIHLGTENHKTNASNKDLSRGLSSFIDVYGSAPIPDSGDREAINEAIYLHCITLIFDVPKNRLIDPDNKNKKKKIKKRKQ